MCIYYWAGGADHAEALDTRVEHEGSWNFTLNVIARLLNVLNREKYNMTFSKTGIWKADQRAIRLDLGKSVLKTRVLGQDMPMGA